tara:strand:- start:113 stop:631 length:519 start_codon:yes stop_codon:yes gene_type:complete
MWAQWISVIGVIAGLITALFVAIGAWISVARKFDRIDSRFDRVEARFDLIEHAIDQIRVQGNGHLALTGSLVTALTRNQLISSDELVLIIQNFVSIGGVLNVPTNPLTPYEYERLTAYLELAQAGGPFTPEQVREYRAIVAKMEAEKPKDPEVWGWVALGALLLGIYLMGKE